MDGEAMYGRTVKGQGIVDSGANFWAWQKGVRKLMSNTIEHESKVIGYDGRLERRARLRIRQHLGAAAALSYQLHCRNCRELHRAATAFRALEVPGHCDAPSADPRLSPSSRLSPRRFVNSTAGRLVQRQQKFWETQRSKSNSG